ncbi:LysM peptidoglycan-binding domain-containing protein [Escherichia coli O25]|nr:LysM peptidoglycan-binding domain-containing protein [Escherichia coli O25]
MSAGSPKFTVRRIAALSLVSLWLAGCSDTSNPPAPVSSVNGNAPANTNSGMLITPPPKMGTTSTAQQPQIQPVQQPQIQATQQPQIQPVQPVAQQPVQMENGRIVYNRQYGNIPKGSYSGSTYTVKKGDTLFYIAWITGNDFRDLAQRNNIQAPYALNVGQTLQVGNASGTPITGGNAITQADAAEQGVVIKPAATLYGFAMALGLLEQKIHARGPGEQDEQPAEILHGDMVQPLRVKVDREARRLAGYRYGRQIADDFLTQLGQGEEQVARWLEAENDPRLNEIVSHLNHVVEEARIR